MSDGLKIASDLTLPVDAVTQKFAILGTSGSGKSYAAMKLGELMLDEGAQIVPIDPVGIWWSLRLAKNGKSVGYEQVRVFGGDHGDLPLTKESGALVGRLLAERRFSAVLDVSQFTTGEMKSFLTEFAEQFFQSKKSHKSPVHLFLEECQTYLPQQTSDREDAKMLNRWERLIKFFRNYGGGSSMISQQPQSVNKKCLNLADTLFAMRTIGSHERKAILSWVKDVVESESDLVANLPKLPTGVAHIWSPSWLKISRDITILPKITFDAGKTPEMGVDAVEPKPLTPVDVDQLRTEMSEMIEKVKADDPRELRAQIAQLKRDLAKRPLETKSPAEVRSDPRAIERAVAAAVKPYRDQLQTIKHHINRAARSLPIVRSSLEDLEKAVVNTPDPPVVSVTEAVTRPAPLPPPAPREPRTVAAANGDLTRPEQNILDQLAELEALGIQQPEKAQLSLMAGYTNSRSGGFSEPLGRLLQYGYASYPQPGLVKLTDVGRAHAKPVDRPMSVSELHERLCQKLGGPEAKLLREIISIYPDKISKEDLGARLGYTNVRSGGFSEPVGRLRSLGIIQYPERNAVRAADWLFLETA